MKTLKIIALVAFALVFSQCKTTTPTAPSGAAASLLEVQQILDTTESKFLVYADSANGDPWRALMLTANWVQSQPNVQSVATIDSAYLDIVLSSGLQADFFFNSVDDSGHSIFRGGGGKDLPEQSRISFHDLSTKQITNKKVLIYAPAWSEFDLAGTVPQTVSTLSNPSVGLNVTVLKDEMCTPDLANTFKDYGLVILDTHGLPDGYMSGSIIDIARTNNTESLYRSAVILQLGQEVYDRILSKDYRVVRFTDISLSTPNWQKRKDLKRIEKVFVTTQYLKNIPSLANTIVFGNMCYSGYSVSDPARNVAYPIRSAFLDKNPISYYCFALANGRSTQVTDAFSKIMEDSLSKRLVNDLDSTGIANLNHGDWTEYFDTYLDKAFNRHVNLLFKHFGADNYSYAQPCGDTLIDPRDNQKYATVCIGKQQWMAENLRYNAPGSTFYTNDSVYLISFGRLYDAATISTGACPKGWHVPNSAEWQQLFDQFGGIDKAGGALKSVSNWDPPNIGATNLSGFNGLAGGYQAFNGSYNSLYAEGLFGSSSLDSSGYPLIMFLEKNYVQAFLQSKGTGNKVSCRCLKD